MRFGAIAIIVAVLAGCGVSTKRYYLPVDPGVSEVGTVCGFEPWGRTAIPLAKDLTISFDVLPSNGRIAAGIQIALPKGVTVRFPDPTITFRDELSGRTYAAPLDRWRLSVYGREGRPGHHEYLAANDILDGRGRSAESIPSISRDLFISAASVPAPALSELQLIVPRIEINGTLIEPKVIALRLKEWTGLTVCI